MSQIVSENLTEIFFQNGIVNSLAMQTQDHKGIGKHTIFVDVVM